MNSTIIHLIVLSNAPVRRTNSQKKARKIFTCQRACKKNCCKFYSYKLWRVQWSSDQNESDTHTHTIVTRAFFHSRINYWFILWSECRVRVCLWCSTWNAFSKFCGDTHLFLHDMDCHVKTARILCNPALCIHDTFFLHAFFWSMFLSCINLNEVFETKRSWLRYIRHTLFITHTNTKDTIAAPTQEDQTTFARMKR